MTTNNAPHAVDISDDGGTIAEARVERDGSVSIRARADAVHLGVPLDGLDMPHDAAVALWHVLGDVLDMEHSEGVVRERDELRADVETLRDHLRIARDGRVLACREVDELRVESEKLREALRLSFAKRAELRAENERHRGTVELYEHRLRTLTDERDAHGERAEQLAEERDEVRGMLDTEREVCRTYRDAAVRLSAEKDAALAHLRGARGARDIAVSAVRAGDRERKELRDDLAKTAAERDAAISSLAALRAAHEGLREELRHTREVGDHLAALVSVLAADSDTVTVTGPATPCA